MLQLLRRFQKNLDPLQLYLLDLITIPANLGGFPAISLPAAFSTAGLDKKKLPIGIQFLAPQLVEQELLNHALWFEENYLFKKPTLPI